jgi:oxaloacetate decarboxylase gamma subunit
MPIEDLLLSGVNLMILGMGIVFVFLLMLVSTMKGMSRLSRIVSERQGAIETLSSQAVVSGQEQAGVRGDLIAVIAAAIKQYRSIHH